VKVAVRVVGRGTVVVSDRWTDEAVEADPKGYEEALAEALPDAIDDSQIEFEVEVS
jgi:hypothetical protein